MSMGCSTIAGESANGFPEIEERRSSSSTNRSKRVSNIERDKTFSPAARGRARSCNQRERHVMTATARPKPESSIRKPLQWGEHDPHRRSNTPLSMWAWLWQRIQRRCIVVLLVLHITLPYKLALQFLLLLTVTFHATLGLRVILLDFNLVSVRYHKILAWGLPILGLIILFFVW